MINYVDEHDKLEYGFNIYKPDNRHSSGFKLKYWKGRVLIVRYSKLSKLIHLQHINTNENF